MPALGGVCSWGCLVPGSVPGPRGMPGADPPRMATAVGGTHPTGMHSCFVLKTVNRTSVFTEIKPF